MRISRSLSLSCGLLIALIGPSGALAQDSTLGGEYASPAASPPPADPQWQQTPAEAGAEPMGAEPMGALPVVEDEPPDGPRFRGGVAFTLGGEFVSNADFSALMYGVDGRLGVQINHLVGLYVEPHLSFGSGTTGFGGSGLTGTYAAIAMVDFTILDTIFVGAGVGYGIFNNPSGAALGFRVGAYPAKSVSTDRPRRKGLMLSLDVRTVFLGDVLGTGLQVMGAVGYEAF